MKICFLSHSAKFGGAERVLYETVAAFKHLGVDCHVMLPSPGELSDRLYSLGVSQSYVPLAFWVTWQKSTVFSKLKAICKLCIVLPATIRAVRLANCDILYTNSISIWNGAVAALLLRLRHVWHVHEAEPSVTAHFGESLSLRIASAVSSDCIVVSKFLASKCAGNIAASKMRVIYPSMELATSMSGEPESACNREARRSILQTLKCVVVGGLTEWKGQIDALQAVASLREQGVDVELRIVGGGTGSYRERLVEFVHDHQMKRAIHFAGRVCDAAALIREADVMLVCSRCEWFGRVTIEGMLAGKPIIGARAGATAELVKDGINGLLYEPGDGVDLAAKIKLLYEQPDLAFTMGENGRRWARQLFTLERYCGELEFLLSAQNT